MNTTIASDDVQALYPGHDPSNVNLYMVRFTDDSDAAIITYAGHGQDAYYCLPEYRAADGGYHWVEIDGSQAASAEDVADWVASQSDTTVSGMHPIHVVFSQEEHGDLMDHVI